MTDDNLKLMYRFIKVSGDRAILRTDEVVESKSFLAWLGLAAPTKSFQHYSANLYECQTIFDYARQHHAENPALYTNNEGQMAFALSGFGLPYNMIYPKARLEPA